MSDRAVASPSLSAVAIKFVVAWLAGFLATLVFHQGAALVAYFIGMGNLPYNMTPRAPLGVPAVFSLAFWGGVWAIAFLVIDPFLPRGLPFWLRATLFGAILPTLGTWMIVQPLRGQALFNGFRLDLLPRVMIYNGLWGLGSALFFNLIAPRLGGRAES
jgi:hypothetical protein